MITLQGNDIEGEQYFKQIIKKLDSIELLLKNKK